METDVEMHAALAADDTITELRRWEQEFVESIGNQLDHGNMLTERQSTKLRQLYEIYVEGDYDDEALELSGTPPWR